MMRIEVNTARGTLRRGLSVSSASAAEFSQPMNRYTASGNPAASPEKPLVMWLGSNGVRFRCPPLEISAATDTTTSTSISNAKKNPAILVDTLTPRIIMTTASAVRITVKIPHGMFQPR
jgi:hypothetical protein